MHYREYYDEDQDCTVLLPYEWEICDCCGGEGQHAHAIDGDGFTQSEWHEMCCDDPDFEGDYLRGRYDRECEECGGSGKIEVPVEPDKNAPEEVREAYENKIRDAEIDAQLAYEAAWERKQLGGY
jgi:DnaJ-class molecular chaperone